jgi:hypothetical protein
VDGGRDVAGIVKRDFEAPDHALQFVHGRSLVVQVGENEEVWRSELEPGWNWDEDLEPYAEGATSCPMTHREYVVAGRIRYLTEDGTEEIGSAGDFLSLSLVTVPGSSVTRPAS